MKKFYLGDDVMDMGLVSLSMGMSQANVMREAGVGMMRNALDQIELQGEQIAQMIEAAMISLDGTGNIIDLSV